MPVISNDILASATDEIFGDTISGNEAENTR